MALAPPRLAPIAFVLPLLLCSSAGAVCWEFDEIDPHYVYSTDLPHVFPNGFVGLRAGDHGGTALPYSEMTGGLLILRGGTGDFSDRVGIDAPIGTAPIDWKVTVTYLHGAVCSSRPVFDILESAGFRATVNPTTARLNGVDAPFTPVADTWYTLEVINNAQAGIAELRIWLAVDPRPTFPLITAIATGAPTNLEVRGNNLCAPEVQVESLCFDAEGPTDVTVETWAFIKAAYR